MIVSDDFTAPHADELVKVIAAGGNKLALSKEVLP